MTANLRASSRAPSLALDHAFGEQPFEDGFHHPSSEAELVDLVRRAVRRGLSVRVRGSARSVLEAIDSDARRSGVGSAIDILLDRYVALSFDDERMEVTVQAGCHLGVDPRDPTRTSTFDTSLVAQLERRGWALPDLAGVTYQTISGFLATGSCGGTVQHALERAIVGFRLVDGRGQVHDLRRDRDEDFDAVGCSMGLLGILSTVTLRCVPRYDIVGAERIEAVESAEVDLFSEGRHGLEHHLRHTEYTRLMWWPQRGVERLATWSARRMRPEDYDATTGPAGALVPKRYRSLGDGAGRLPFGDELSLAAQAAGGLFYDSLALGARAMGALTPRAPRLASSVRARAGRWLERTVLPTVIDAFVPLDTSAPQSFWDSWWAGLPMDNQMSEACMPTTFTEIFLPIEESARAMRLLEDHFHASGLAGTGAFVFELYASASSRFWMHPSYGRDSVRVDVFWFARNPGDPRETFFPQFWKLLAPFGYRLHWGKHLPHDPALGCHYLRRQLPRWDDFLAARARLDPHGVFSTSYWRTALGFDA